ncbi:hypothetical protein LDC_2438, partial [sediment metagenome]
MTLSKDKAAPVAADHGQTGPQVGILSFLLGVLLPAFTLLFEAVSRMCASLAFDPIPTVWHIMLAATVPVANAAVFLSIRYRDTRHLPFMLRFNGVAIGVSACYACAFAALTPLAVLALIACGLGLLPLSPLISLIVAMTLRRKLRKLAMQKEQEPIIPKLRYTFSATVAMMLFLCLPNVLTFTGAKLASRYDTRASGMQLLRNYGSEKILLRYCYSTNNPLSPASLLSALLSILNVESHFLDLDTRDAQQLYYRLTGAMYNSVVPPDMRSFRRDSIGPVDTGEFDRNQGGDSVAAPVKNLFLKESGLDAIVDSDSATSYTEWTLVFQNDSYLEREARAQAVLPPGGVVSRLTLWVNGKEREAAYNARAKVKNAYKSIVQQRRDPVLVTTSGKDRIMLQCFPVPPTGGVMKIRIGITAPLALESPEQGLLRTPFFIEKNFSIPDTNRQAIRMQANSAIATFIPSAEFSVTSSKENTHCLAGSLPGPLMSRPFTIRLSRQSGTANTWTEKPAAGKGDIVCQSIIEKPIRMPGQTIIVIDGSSRMAQHKEAISRAIAGLPEEARFSILLADDDFTELRSMRRQNAAGIRIAAESIMDTSFEGGRDNAPALNEAFRLLEGYPDGAILWIHSTQPVELPFNPELARRIRDRVNDPVLYEVQLDAGVNILSQRLEDAHVADSIPDFDDAGHSLRKAFSILSGKATVFQLERTSGSGEIIPKQGNHAWQHVARLWANGEILKLEKSGKQEDLARAVSIAMAHQLVTP